QATDPAQAQHVDEVAAGVEEARVAGEPHAGGRDADVGPLGELVHQAREGARLDDSVAVDQGHVLAGGGGNASVAAAGVAEVASGRDDGDAVEAFEHVDVVIGAAVVDQDDVNIDLFGREESYDAATQPRLGPPGQHDGADGGQRPRHG